MFKKIAALTLLALVVGITPALADTYTVASGTGSWNLGTTDDLNYLTYLGITSSDYTVLTSPAIAGLSGQYNITTVGHDATQTNYLYDGANLLFSTEDVHGTGGAQAYGTWMNNVSLNNLSYETSFTYAGSTLGSDTYTFALDSDRFHVYQLTTAVNITINGSTYNLPVGTLLIFLNDNYDITVSYNGMDIQFKDPDYDTDFDDMILIATPTPIPGALWLLGTGLLGLVGLRRKFK